MSERRPAVTPRAAPTPAAAQEPAEEKLLEAEAKALSTLKQAELKAVAKMRGAEAPARAMVRRAEVVAEATLQHARVRSQRDAFERFFALSLDMMCILTTDGRFERVSPSFDTLGFQAGDLLDQPLLSFIHPDDEAATREALERLATGATVRFESRFRSRTGSFHWLSWASGPDSAGVLHSVARDVTEARLSAQALARAKEEAEAAGRELESFSSSVAHDLRAPLRGIDGFSQALLEDCSDVLDAEGRRYLSFIREAAQHMAQLIDDLLALSRITRAELHREVVDLTALGLACNTRLQSAQPARAVTVTIAEGLSCIGDPRLLRVVLDNLFGNAWKFTSRTADAHIEMGASTVDGRAVYFVRDDGAGFDMAYAHKLFGVFQRLHTTEEFEGTGVGLATVQRILQRHGGRIWGEGSVDHGATFFFTIEPPERH